MSKPVLDTVERVSEMCFGLFMALTFIGAVSVMGGTDSPRTVFYTAFGCNLAWGLVDAVMYLVRTLAERGRQITAAAAPGRTPDRPRLQRRDFVGAFGIFLIVATTTFPIALPFVIFDDGRFAIYVSRACTLAMLFGGGFALGRYSGYGGWRAGLAMTAMGVVLTAAVIALGG
jgi:VIT1/CCC1 family predicted Fe2+/Mn2+ transporter